MTIVQINANVPWKCFRSKDGPWIAVCDPLRLTLQADTWAFLMEDISNALNVIFKDLLETNELEQFLRDRGWEPVGPLPSKPEEVSFDIPFLPTIDRDSQVPLH